MSIDDRLDRSEYEKQFDGRDPDDSDLPGSNEAGDEDDGDDSSDTAAPAPAPAPAVADAPTAAPAPSPADAAPADAAPADAAPADAAATDTPEAFVPEPRAPLREAPEDAEVQLAAADDKRADALQKFDDGHISREEFEAIDKEARTLERELTSKMARDAAREAVAQEAVMRMWDDKRTAAINELVKAGIKPDADTILEFDKITGAWGDIAASRKMVDGPDLKASTWALQQAVAALKATRGVVSKVEPSSTLNQAPKKTEAEARAARQVDMSKVPPSLATAPLAQEATVTGDRFAKIDGLGLREQERAIAAMSEAELAEYLDR